MKARNVNVKKVPFCTAINYYSSFELHSSPSIIVKLNEQRIRAVQYLLIELIITSNQPAWCPEYCVYICPFNNVDSFFTQ